MHGPLAARLSLAVEQGPQGMQASVVAARGLQGSGSGVLVHELGEPQHVDLPGPGIERMSVALAGGFFITGPPRKPLSLFLSVVKIY